MNRTLVIIAIIFILGFSTAGDAKTEFYQRLHKSPLTPPDWTFGVVWPILYVLMGVSYGKILDRVKFTSMPSILFLLQLTLNLSWSPVFFTRQDLKTSLAIIILLFITICATIVSFMRVDKIAAYLMLPYLVWVGFATYLNWYIVSHNSFSL